MVWLYGRIKINLRLISEGTNWMLESESHRRGGCHVGWGAGVAWQVGWKEAGACAKNGDHFVHEATNERALE